VVKIVLFQLFPKATQVDLKVIPFLCKEIDRIEKTLKDFIDLSNTTYPSTHPFIPTFLGELGQEWPYLQVS
jgi:hypothetical protein